MLIEQLRNLRTEITAAISDVESEQWEQLNLRVTHISSLLSSVRWLLIERDADEHDALRRKQRLEANSAHRKINAVSAYPEEFK